jgi:serine/threonine protein kinase
MEQGIKDTRDKGQTSKSRAFPYKMTRMMDPVTSFVELLGQCRLLEPPQWEELNHALKRRFHEPHALAKELLQRGWLSPYQVNQVFQGRGGDLVLGSYVLLERLGEGGMGQIYKARHRRLGRIVALKLIRKERLSNPAAVSRFHREILAAAQLDHPNIVLAYDADAVDGVHFYTMEYVEGSTFKRLICTSGPFLVPLACEAIRQAALGLQHAFARGLVHRDVNPSNLMLTWVSQPTGSLAHAGKEGQTRALWGSHTPLVKILDVGLARIHLPGDEARPSGSTTQMGMLMGTPDFIAPEQARDPRQADTRADIYSLGCTFYYILAGALPFPGGTKMEKVIRHQLEQPRPLEQLRPETPVEVLRIVRKMMAKRPEERYQTPGEVAAELG